MSRQHTAARTKPLSDADLRALRENLLRQRSFRREQLRQLEAGPSGPPRAGAALDEVHTEIAAAARMVLGDVEEALQRLADGVYGDCRRCRSALDLAYLRLVPQARLCLNCRQSHFRQAQFRQAHFRQSHRRQDQGAGR